MEGWQILEQAAEMSRHGESFALATVVWRQGPSSSQPGSRAIITAGGELRGWIGGACAEPAVIRAAGEVLATGEAQLLLLGSLEQFGAAATFGGGPRPAGTVPPGTVPPGSAAPGMVPAGAVPGVTVPHGMIVVPVSCQSEGALEVYIEPCLPVPHLVVVGRSPMARTLAGLARTLGWRTDLTDGSDLAAAGADGQSMIVVATQGHNDEAVVERAVAARPAYLGLVGSAKRGAAVLGYLADRGVPAEQLDRVRVPAGLDLGHTTHAEIAVAILAELVQLRASGEISAARPAPAASAAPAAADPVCGMTVSPGPDTPALEHAGRTYYFCNVGCRTAFSADPARYDTEEAAC